MPNTQKIEEWEKEFDCFDFICGECEICRYLDFIDNAQSVGTVEGTEIQRNTKIENYLRLKENYKNSIISQAQSATRKEMREEIEERKDILKKQLGDIPENTCPSIDKVIRDIESYINDIEYLRKRADKYDDVIEFAKDLPDFGWKNPISDLDGKLRNDNEKLREIGKAWYEEFVDLLKLPSLKVEEGKKEV